MLALARHRIETDRLVLRPPVQDDAPRIAELANDIEIARYLATMPHPYRLQDAEEFIARVEQTDASDVFAIWPKQEQCLVGLCGYGPPPDGGEHVDFGYWLGLDYRGRGYAREAAGAVLTHAFCVSQIDEIETDCRIDNPRSKQLLDRLGFVTLGRSKRHSLAENVSMPTHRVRLTCADWLQSRACA